VANTKSAEKRMRQAAERNARNTAIRSTVRTAMKKVREADQAAAKGVLKGRGASRKVSRLAKAVSGAGASAQ
jgi:small subunit ribosomal protein S20